MTADAPAASSVIRDRREQAFPRLSPDEIDRLRRFGEVRAYADGERLFAAGEPGPGGVYSCEPRMAQDILQAAARDLLSWQ